jgi:hypothetical protein
VFPPHQLKISLKMLIALPVASREDRQLAIITDDRLMTSPPPGCPEVRRWHLCGLRPTIESLQKLHVVQIGNARTDGDMPPLTHIPWHSDDSAVFNMTLRWPWNAYRLDSSGLGDEASTVHPAKTRDVLHLVALPGFGRKGS